MNEYVDVPLVITGEIPSDAWITFVPSDTPPTEKDGDDANESGRYARLVDVVDGSAHFQAPSKTGAYDIRVYDGEDADTAREIAFKSVWIVEGTASTEPTTTAPTKETEEQSDARLLPGDVNLDGTVDIMDVISINRYLLGSNTLGPVAKKNADVDGTGTIDTTDSLLILKYVVEIIDGFGTETPGTTEPPAPTENNIDFSNVRIDWYLDPVPANSNAAIQLTLPADADFTGSTAWAGLFPAGADLSAYNGKASALSYTYLADASYKKDDGIYVGVFVPAGTAPGAYELLVFASDNGGEPADRMMITVTEENTVHFDTSSLEWDTIDDGAVLGFAFDYTGEIANTSLVRIMIVSPDAPLDYRTGNDDPEVLGGWATSFTSAGGEYNSFLLNDPYSQWELRAYTDTYNGARLLDRVSIPEYVPDDNR